MKKHWFLIIISTLLLGNIAVGVWNSVRTPRIAYVRSNELVYGYFGMKEAMTDFQNKQGVWKANADTLRVDLEKGITEMRAGVFKGDELTSKKASLQKLQLELSRYQQAMESKMHDEEQKLLTEVFGQVNTFVEQYAKDRGFDMVLGTTDAGNILYGEGGLDITDDLLSALNKEHDGL